MQQTFTRLQAVRKQYENREIRLVHERAVEAAEELKCKEAQLITALQEVDRLLVHRFIGYNSLYRYAVEALKLTEHQAYAYITVARKAAQLPVLQQALEENKLTVFKAQRITPVINEKNQQHWVELASTGTKREIEKAVAQANPKAAQPERIRWLNESLPTLETTLDEKTLDLLKQAQDLIGQGFGSINDTIRELAKFYLEKKDPVRRAERIAEKRVKHDLCKSLETHPRQPEVAGANAMASTPISNNPAEDPSEQNPTPMYISAKAEPTVANSFTPTRPAWICTSSATLRE